MAQVKKFQPGGKLTINGKDYTIDQLNEYMNSGGFSSQERAALAGTIQSIAGGASRTFDRNANSISGEGVTDDFASFYGNEKSAERNQGRTTRWANRQARRNSDHHIVNSALERLGGIEDYYNKKKEEKDEKTRLYKGSDENGFYTSDGRFLEGPENMQNISRITAILDAIQSGDLSKYDLQDWGGDITLSGLTDWYTAQNGSFNREEFFNRLRKNQLTDLDWEVLSKMGFSIGTTPQTSSTTSHKDWKGNADAATRAGVYFTKDDKGNWILNSADSSNQYLGSNWYAGGLDFLAGTQWADGMIGSDGRLYTRDEVLNGILRNSETAAFLAAMDARDWRSWYDAANASGVRFVGDRTSRGGASDNYGIFNTQFNPNEAYNEYWQNYFSELGNRNYDIADLSNIYSNLNGRQILAYVDPTGAHDNMGIRSVKYVVRNADGTYKTYDNESALQSGEGLTHVDRWWGVSPSEFSANKWETIGNKRYALAYVLNTDGNQQNVILRGEDGKFYVKRGNDAKPQLVLNEELLRQILANPQNYNNEAIEKLYKVSESEAKKRWAGYGYGYLPSNKNGGAISKIKPLPEKFQYGGNLGKTTTVKKEDSTEGKRTDITASHSLKGDGGLTKAEKMQIAAAIGDLAGVGLSFGKGTTSWLGAGLGLASTGTRFIADIKKDGFQGKDLGSALAGAALDVASIISTGAATAKAVKTLQAAAEPIMKALALAGAANGVSAMGKVVRGEKVTSEDITAIISGLGSSMIAGKNLKDTLGKAKLSKQIETDVLKTQNANVDKELGTTLKKKPKEIAKIIEDAGGSQQKVLEEIKKQLKSNDPNSNPTTADARKVLEEWGVSFDGRSRFSGKSGEKWYQRINPFKKGEKQVSFAVPTEQEAHSILRYMLNPRLRAQQLGYDAGYFGQKSGNLGTVTRKELSNAIRAVESGDATLAQQELVKLTARNPDAFGFSLNEEVTNMNSGWGWPIMGRRVKYESPVSGVKYESPTSSIQLLDEVPMVHGVATPTTRVILQLPAPLEPLALPGPSIPLQIPAPSIPLALPAPPRSLDPTIPKGLLNEFEQLGFYGIAPNSPKLASRIPPIPSESGYFPPTGRVSNGWVMRNYDPMFEFKQGGKIQFAKCGKKITKHQNTSVLPTWKYSDLTAQEQAEYKTALEAARTSGQDFIYKGYNFGKVGTSTAVPTDATTTVPTAVSNLTDTLGNENMQNATAAVTKIDGDYLDQEVAQVIANLGKNPPDLNEQSYEPSLGYDIQQTYGKNSQQFSDYKKSITDIAREAAIANGTDPTVAVKDRLKALRYEIAADRKAARQNQKAARQNQTGSVTGSGSNSNWLNITGNIAGSIGKAATAYDASKRQMDLVNDMKPFQEQQAQGHSFKYRDPGIDLAYNNAINQQQSYARNFKSRDQASNASVGLQTADKTAQLELERGLKKAQFFGEQQAQHQNLSQQEAQNWTAGVNRNAERANQMDAYKGKMKGAYIAQNQGITQGLIDDITGIGQRVRAGKLALDKFNLQNDYADAMSKWKTEYESGVTDGKHSSGLSYEEWLRQNHNDDIREFKRRSIPLSVKNGGRIRPTAEQIKIDNEKARHKAIAQLSKQAFELLKMALS